MLLQFAFVVAGKVIDAAVVGEELLTLRIKYLANPFGLRSKDMLRCNQCECFLTSKLVVLSSDQFLDSCFEQVARFFDAQNFVFGDGSQAGYDVAFAKLDSVHLLTLLINIFNDFEDFVDKFFFVLEVGVDTAVVLVLLSFVLEMVCHAELVLIFLATVIFFIVLLTAHDALCHAVVGIPSFYV